MRGYTDRSGNNQLSLVKAPGAIITKTCLCNTRGGQVIFEQTVGSICIEVDI